MHRFVLFCERYGIAIVPLALIILGCGFWPEMEILVPSLPDMRLAFGVEEAQIAQLLTVNFVGFLIGVLFVGPLCDSWGRKRLLVISVCVYLAASAACTLSLGFNFLLVARFVQGMAMTGPVVAGTVLMMESVRGPRMIYWMALGQVTITLCMSGGPLLGAWINQLGGYKANLWVIVGLAVVGSLPALLFVSETLPQEQRSRPKWGSLFAGYWTLLKDWRFMTLGFPSAALGGIYFTYVGISALYMVDYLGIDAADFGLYQGPLVASYAVVSLASTRLLRRFGLLPCLRTGVAMMGLGAVALLIVCFTGSESPILVTFILMIFVGGNAPLGSLLWPLSVGHLPPTLQGNAQSLLQALRLFVAATGTFVLGLVYTGPLLPLAIIFALVVAVCFVLLWLGKPAMRDHSTANFMSSGH